jgi:hypothetical protein
MRGVTVAGLLALAGGIVPSPDVRAGEAPPAPEESLLPDFLNLPVSGLKAGEPGQTTLSDQNGLSSTSPPPGSAKGRKKEGEFFAAPLPFSNPTFGWGLGAVVGYITPLNPADTVSPPTLLAVTGFYAENGSWGAGLGGMTYLDEDRWRLTAALGTGRINIDFSGIGADAGSQNDAIPLINEARGLLLQGLGRVLPGLYAGPRLLCTRVTTRVDASDLSTDAGGFLDGSDASVFEAAVGLRVQYDTRDSTFYPTRGVLLDTSLDMYSHAYGSDFDYTVWDLAANGYIPLAEGHVLALRGYTRFVSPDAPFFALSFLGRGPDLRGYAIGQYQDQLLMDIQAEYRADLIWKIGAVAFAGVGTVAPDPAAIEKFFPSGGVGLRYTVAPENHVNLRLDFAWGTEGFIFYLAVGEAF